jgi:sugar/nucleoside kinase (ribokinase family)
VSEAGSERRRIYEAERRRAREGRPIRLAVAGGINWDRVRTWRGEEMEGFGGIIYNTIAWAYLTRPGDKILPIAWVGEDRRQALLDLLAGYPQVDTAGIHRHPDGTNEVKLTYETPAHRVETLTSRVPALGPEELMPARLANFLLVNMISGFDLTPDTLQKFAHAGPTPIYLDIQSMTLSVREEGTREACTVPDWREWCQVPRVLKGNEDEVLLFAGNPAGGHRQALHRVALEGPAVVMTRSERGGSAIYRIGTQWFRYVYPALPGIDPVDTTGAGDVFMSALVVALLRGRTFPESLLFAASAAGLACESRGIEGLDRLVSTEEAMQEGYRAELDAIREGYRGEEVELVPIRV